MAMFHIFMILILTAVWVLVQKFALHQTITWVEMLLQAVGAATVVIVVFMLGSYAQTTAMEVWNGQITGRHNDLVSWETCTCVARNDSGSCTNEVCTRHYRQDYYFDTNLPNDILYGSTSGRSYRPDRAFLDLPVGTPASELRPYQNWVRAASSSLFHEEAGLMDRYADMIPAYPSDIPGNRRLQYYPNRVLAVGAQVPDLVAWNRELADILRTLGPQKQANVIVMVTTEPRQIATATWATWRGGNKNDILLAIGVDASGTITWTDVQSWADSELYNVSLRDAVMDIGTLDRARILAAVNSVTTELFTRRPMSDFEYLRSEIQPTGWVLVTMYILWLLSMFGMSAFFHHNELGELANRFSRSGYRSYRRW